MPPIFSSRRSPLRPALDDSADVSAELKALFEMSPAALALADASGRLLRSNAAWQALSPAGADARGLPALPENWQQLLGWQGQWSAMPVAAEADAVDAWVDGRGGRRIHVRARVRRLAAPTLGASARWLLQVEDMAVQDDAARAAVQINALMGTAGVGVATWDAEQGWTSAASLTPPGALTASAAANGANSQLSIGRDVVETESLADYARLQQALRQREPAEVRYAVRHPDTGRRWLLTRVEPAELGTGRPAMSVVTLDITDEENARRHNEQLLQEQARARESLVQQTDSTRAVLDSVLVGIVTVGPRGIEWMNRSARRMFGGELADFQGLPIAVVASAEPNHPLRRTDWLNVLDEGQAETFECRLVARDGREFWVVGNAVVTGREAGAAQLTFALLDIERRRQAENQIAQAQASLQRIIETAPLAIALFDGRGLQVLRLNQMLSAFARRPAVQIIGRPPSLWLPGPEAAALSADLHQAVASREMVRRELHRDADPVTGEPAREWDVRIVALRDTGDGGAEEHLLLVASDVTEQRAAEQARFEAAIAQREMLVKEVHHRIKNNLQGVAGLLQQNAQRHPEAAAALNEAVGQVHAIAQVHGLQVGMTGPLRVRGVIEAITLSVQRMFGRAIRYDVDGPAPHRFALTEADSIPIALTVNELLTNAIKHSPNGEVRCRLDCEAAAVRISVASASRLPPGFTLSQVPPGISGLGLVRALLPRKGSAMTLEQRGDEVVATLRLEPPAVAVLEPL
ncbi:PAS domain-containing protein [Ideonella sp.]|uniref:PAS domain-containing sensor histidine kinase n=1 Tax=Ideonella sp. TaxID=1929293 RepID=UPI0035B2DAB5